MGSDTTRNGVGHGRERGLIGPRTGSEGGIGIGQEEADEGMERSQLGFLYFEVDFCAFIIKCHFSINVSLGGLKGQGKFY